MSKPRFSVGALQPLGRALMLPIAVLPVASLMLRLGQPDMAFIPGLGHIGPLLAGAGDAIFSNLGLLFAIGVAVGLAKGGDGAAGLAGVVCYLVSTYGAQALLAVPPDAVAGLAGKSKELASAAYKQAATAKLGVPIGILSGLVGGAFYNRFNTVKLPDYLAFFGGRRFVPIISGFAGLVLALVIGAGYASIEHGMDSFSRAVVAAGPVGLFVFGVLNRLLLVTGLHHILNNVAWFILGDFHGATGDLKRFFAGDPSAGAFMSGFFPVMMFGLPAACLAMYHAAKPERRKAVGGMLLSLALTALLTGVTEPIEFSFMFLAPALYVIHALLTGASMALMNALGVHLGFGFSAGLFDYVLNYNKATKPLLLFPVGALYFGLYYGMFRVVIARFDLKTPGREDEPLALATEAGAPSSRAEGFIAALGGAANLASIDACTTRLRLVVADQGAVDEPRLKALGARGLVRPSPADLQVVLGPIADDVAREMRAALGERTARPAGVMAAQAEPIAASTIDAESLLAAVGGRGNVRAVDAAASRLRFDLKSDGAVDDSALTGIGVRAIARPAAGGLQLILGPGAEALARELKAALAA